MFFAISRSNRTFMELKYREIMKAMGTTSSSNRTFMELKFGVSVGIGKQG